MGAENSGETKPWTVVHNPKTGSQEVVVDAKITFSLDENGAPIGAPRIVVAEGQVAVDGLVTIDQLLMRTEDAFDHLPDDAVQDVVLSPAQPIANATPITQVA